jgi:hypothetical protein
MSSEEEAAAAAGNMCCASCGVAAIDDVKLKDCDDGCDLVKYCSDECQHNNREQHEEECKKRLAEIRDRYLFAPPDRSYLGDCSICCLPLPIDPRKTTINTCCSSIICNGCDYANGKREREAGLEHRCAFCRDPLTETEEERVKHIMKRIKKNCPAAMNHMAQKRHREGDYETAVEYWTKAAAFGDIEAHYQLSIIYREGCGVEMDIKKQVYHSEEAAIGGHPLARYNLGCIELRNSNFERARKHWIIAANLGHDKSLKGLRKLYADGHASKEDYADALRAYQAAMDETKSAQREEAKEAIKSGLW